MGIANSILEAVAKEAARHPGSRPTKVGVRIGEMAAIDGEALRFCLEVLAQDTMLDGLQLAIEFCPRCHHCRDCGTDFVIRGYDFACPNCKSEASEFIRGDELELAYVEVEEDEPSAVGTKSSE